MASTTEEPTGEIQEVPRVVTHTLRYKTWVLGVSMHCASCANKVTKVLNVIDGVYITQVDIALQKVTVGGDVKVETLITELYKKTNKRAELLWPSDPDHYDREDNNFREDDGDQAAAVPKEPKANHAGVGGGGDKKGKEPVKEEVIGPVASGGRGTKKNFEVGSSSKGGGSAEVEGSVVKPNGGGATARKGKEKEAVTGNSPSQSPPVVVEKKSGEVEIGDGGSENKKGGKGQDGNENVAEGGEGGGVAPPAHPVPPPMAQPVLPPKAQPVPQPKPYGPPPYVLRPVYAPAHYGPPPQQQQVHENPYFPREHPQQYEQYPPYLRRKEHYFANVHAMDYNAAHPGISFGAARYAVPSASTQARTYAQWEVEVPGTRLDNPSLLQAPTLAPLPYPPHPYDYYSDSGFYSFFSDENPNACSVM